MDHAYAAGLIDGEGCIRLSDTKGVVTPVVEVAMSVRAMAILRWLHRTYGGQLRDSKRDRRATRASCAHWRIAGKASVPFLKQIKPHLKLKLPQAELALWWQEQVESAPRQNKKGRPWTQDFRRLGQRARRRMAELNARGPLRTPDPAKRLVATYDGHEWVSPQMSLLSPLPEPFTGPWPKSGSMRNGFVYEEPAPTAATASSSSPALLPTPDATHGRKTTRTSLLLPGVVELLPTPRASANENRQTRRTPSQEAGTHGRNLAAEVCSLLPTPRATDGTKGGPNQRGSSGDLMLPSAVMLLPTPMAARGGHQRSPSPGARVRPTLDTLARTGVPTAPPSTDGPASSDGPHQLQLSLDEPAPG